MLQDLLSKFSSPAEKQGYLQQLTAAHPYFAPAQFCLLQTLDPGTEAYNHRAAITHLLYNNAHWLQFQMAQTTVQDIAAPSTAIGKDALSATATEAAAPATATETAPEAVEEPTEPILQHLTDETPLNEAAGAVTAANDTVLHEEAPTIIEPILTNTTEGEADLAALEPATAAEPLPDEPLPETIPAAIPPMTAAPSNTDELVFEPLFAVDYFASQGIKLSEEMQPSDKLGLQLKSFTEWLKSMKKAYQPDPQADDMADEAEVPAIAEKSNTEDDVVTEAMAEVFALQGRKQKAVAIYRKLSLLNPHKSAFFAAKIENLK